MGNCLYMPSKPKPEVNNTAHVPLSQQAVPENFRPTNSPVILPFNNVTVRPDGIEEPDREQEEQIATLEIETVKLDNSFIDANTSQYNASQYNASQYSAASKATTQGRYIKRYRNEEEKLMDMLQERERLLNSAIRQGQQLRAKCNRYKDELDSVKETSRLKMNDQQWRKRYYDMERKYRDIKEEVDVMVARNRNGRDYLRQQQDTIDSLSLDLQREKIERQRMLSSSLTSLHSAGVGTKRKGKVLMTQLQVDNSLLQNRVQELTQRNTRGRAYLSKLEAEKREQDKQVIRLKEQLVNEKAEKESLLSRLSVVSTPKSPGSTAFSDGHPETHFTGQELYAKVNKVPKSKHDTMGETALHGFEIDDRVVPIEPERQYNVLSGVYDEVELLPLNTDGAHNGDTLPKRTGSVADSMEDKSVNELNAEAIIDQINIETDPTPRDITSFHQEGNQFEYRYGEENGIPNDLVEEESYTKF